MGSSPLTCLPLARERLRVERGVGQRAVAPDEGAPVGHAVDREHLRVRRGQEVRGGHHRVAMQARLARHQQRAPCGLPARLDEQVGEGRMRLVGLGVRQHRLEVRDQFERARFLARVVQRDVAQLGVVLGADEHRGAHLQAGAGRVELHVVGQEAGAVAPAVAGRGQGGERGEFLGALVAHKEEGAVAVAQRVVAPARHVERVPAAHAGAVGAQGNGVAAVRQQVRGLEAGRRRVDKAGLEQRRQLGLAGPGGVRGSALPMIWRGVRSCSSDSCACTSAALPNQRRGASARSTLHSATSDMPWWCAMKLRTTVKSWPSGWRETVKSTAS